MKNNIEDSSQDKNLPEKEIIELENPFIDQRGEIQPLVDKIMKSAVMIHSKAGSMRANHYHKTDWHYCYVISGEIEYYHRKTNSLETKKKIYVKEGQMVFTPPMVDHAMVFNVDTTFLTLSRNFRDQKTYESDVVRIELIDSKDFITWKPNF
tara:strand:+ start:125 stop:580 length:456 start_codon:yes stop_codon:yes gene_type:complete